MKKFIVFVLAGSMLVTAPVLAAEKTERTAVPAASESEEDEGYEEGDEGIEDDEDGEGSKSPSASTVKPKPKDEIAAPVAAAPAVEATSVSAAVAEAAAAEGKTIGEYLNNAVTSVPGLENVVPIGQGGHVIINGAPSNQVFSVLKPTRENVSSAKLFAAGLNGKVLNVVRISASINGFRTAQVNFYMKGVKTGQNIKVFQISNGRWLEVDVTEIRDDHVVVEMTSLGTLAFLEMPSK